MIYFISQNNNKFIKIGYIEAAENINSRISNIQTNNPYLIELLGIIPGDRETEKRYHWRYKPYSIRGEWFMGEPIIKDVMGQIEVGDTTSEAYKNMEVKVVELFTIHAAHMADIHRHNHNNMERAKDIHWGG